MEAGDLTAGPARRTRLPTWAIGVLPLVAIVAAIALFAALGGPGLGERNGPPVEELAVERTVLRPGEIKLIVRNDGPDPVTISQVSVNDAYQPFQSDHSTIDRLGGAEISIPYDWIEGENYELIMLTSTGATIDHAVESAVETPSADLGFFGLMALLGIYVGVIPVSLGMLWLPFVRRIDERWIKVLMALAVGLLFFLAVDATLEGSELAGDGSQAFGGLALLVMGAALAYLTLAAIDSHLRDRARAARESGARAGYLSLLIAIGIGLHNLGEGLAIGAAYTIGALALGSFLVIGFAIHNTTEGLAIVAPLKNSRPSLKRLLALGLIAGAPAILGAWIGAAAFNASLAAFLLGIGVGAIAQVIQQIAPTMRNSDGRMFYPASVAGLAAGILLLYVTGLLVSV